MVSLNKSFLYGICFASVTWIISLYLYFQITSNENSTKKSADLALWTREQILPKTQVQKIPSYEHNNTHFTKNSAKLIKKLTPIKKNVELDNGKCCSYVLN